MVREARDFCVTKDYFKVVWFVSAKEIVLFLTSAMSDWFVLLTDTSDKISELAFVLLTTSTKPVSF